MLRIRESIVLLLVACTVTMVTGTAPVFDRDLYIGRIMEEDINVPVHVMTVSALDPDGDTDIWYSLQDTADHYFSIDPRTGAIEAIKPLDREEIPRYLLVAVATDHDGLGESGFSNIVIELDDVNDNGPIFPHEPYFAMVTEGSSVGTSVIRVMAEDPDDINVGQNAVIQYRITHNAVWNNSDEIFFIDPITSEITTMVDELDRESGPMYEIVVEAKDGAEHIGTATVTIAIMDKNDNPPMFSHHWYFTTVNENTEIGAPVYIVRASDMDANDVLTFDIIDGNENDTFSINNTSVNQAVIMVQEHIDYENPWQPKEYNLTLHVSDGVHSNEAMLMIIIEDVNENQPLFTQPVYQERCSEDVAMGTSIGNVIATDADEDHLMYSIQQATDPMGLFHIDEHNGTVSVVGVLDRETMDRHNITVVVHDQGQPQLSDTAYFIVDVDDVNDNAPMFAEDYRPTVPENVAAPVHVVLISAVDVDTVANGAHPFTYTVDNSSDITDYFTLEQVGNEANITSRVTFDREEQEFYYMPIIISDVQGLSATSTLTIGIGDDNEFPHSAGTKHITAYQYGGRGSRVIGYAYAPDKDTGGTKYYDIVNGSDYFEIDSSTGAITIIDRTPEGSYVIQVTVQDLSFPAQISHIFIDVIYIFDDVIRNSASLRLSEITAEEFINIPDNEANSKLQNFTESLAKIMSIESSQVIVFSVAQSFGPMRMPWTDLRYFVRGYRPESLDAKVATHREMIENEVGIHIAMVNINECMDENICDSGSCSSMMVLDRENSALIDSGMASFSLSVSTYTTFQCVCQSAVCQLHSCDPNPCFNGGQCMPTGQSYQCHCPPQFSGPQCQDISRSFQGNGYAMYESLVSCTESHTSLEFLTKSANGLLLYNGPIATPVSANSGDFLAMALKDGMINLHIDLGSGELHLDIPGSPRLDDGKWHRIDVQHNGQDITLMIDYCMTSDIEEYPTYSNENTSSCLAMASIPGASHVLNLNTPLQVGGVAQDDGFVYPPNMGVDVMDSFSGCVRNLMQDNKVYDLGMPAMHMNTDNRCQLTDASCFVDGQTNPEPLCIHGTCMADMDTVYCLCDAGYHGPTCEELTPPYDFAADSYVMYGLDNGPQMVARTSDYKIMFRTRETRGTIWHISSPETREGVEYIHVGLVDGMVNVFYDIGEGEQRLVLENVKVDDGVWHSVHLLRQRNVIMVHLDNGGDACHTAKSNAGTFRELEVDKDSLIIGAMVQSSSVVPGENFVGCLNDPRIDGMYLGFASTTGGIVAMPSSGVTQNCTSNVCMNDTCTAPRQCTDLWRHYECTCEDGEEYIASNNTCQEVDDCAVNPCFNDAVCQDGTRSVTCLCSDDYWGEFCQYSSLCASNPCENGASCEDLIGDFICVCLPEYHGDHCEEYDNCFHDPCLNSGTCVDGDDAYTCVCPVGYRGDNCEESAPCDLSPCENGGVCDEIDDSFVCDCPVGYIGETCNDNDLCASQPCFNNANCTVTFGLFGPNGYTCDCQEGFRGESCEEIDYCRPNPCENEGICEELEGEDGFVCTCAWSYKGETCDEFDNITLRITLSVTLFGIIAVTLILCLALCCARRYQKKMSLKKDTDKQHGETELTLVAVTSKTAANGVDSNQSKQSNNYETMDVVKDEDGIDNTAFVHVYDNNVDGKEQIEEAEIDGTTHRKDHLEEQETVTVEVTPEKSDLEEPNVESP